MRILHTSDWHFGKNLEYATRILEQEKFIKELKNIVVEENIDLILVAGDVYDTINPKASAEKLFYKSVKSLTCNGKVPIIIIAGNHDNPERLTATSPLLNELGIILVGSCKTIVDTVNLKNYSIINSGQGFLEIEIKGEKAVIILMPYPSDKRLNEILSYDIEEEKIQKTYSEKISEIFLNLSKNFKDDTINIILGHFYIKGGYESQSERDIKLGGSMAVDPLVFPKNSDYIAMGHLHRAQKIKGTIIKHAYYSGSPIQYSKSEIGYAKLVYIVDINKRDKKRKINIKKRYLSNYKPIELWKTKSIEEAINKCEKHKEDNTWVFLEIETDRPLLNSEIKKIRTTKNDIIEITPIIINKFENTLNNIYEEKTIEEEFIDFYKEKRGTCPTEKTKKLFLDILNKDIDNIDKGD